MNTKENIKRSEVWAKKVNEYYRITMKRNKPY